MLLSVPTDSYLRSPIILALGLFLAASAFTPVLKTLSRRVPDGLVRQGSRLRIAAAVWLVCTIPVLMFKHRQVDQLVQAWTDEWQMIGVWARENTPVDAIFMNPVVKANIPPYTDEEVGGLRMRYSIILHTDVFGLASRRAQPSCGRRLTIMFGIAG